MPNVDLFMEEVVTDLRRRLALLGDSGDRRSVEDSIALLTDYRLAGMDEAAFQRLLASLRAGRSPVALAVLKPQLLAGELSARWMRYTEGAAIAVAN